MAAGAIGGAMSGMGGVQGTELPEGARTNRFAELESTDFVNVLVQELSNQDPFEPNDSAQILEQLSSLRNIESQNQLQDRIKDLVLQNEIAQAGGMIGRMVQGLDEGGNRIDGVVTSVRIKEGKAVLELDTGKQLPMSRVERIADEGGDTATG